MALLDDGAWQGKIWSGAWTEGSGETYTARIASGLVHINDQTVNDEAVAPFGGVGASGTGSRHGGSTANVEAFTETQWVTVRGDLPAYPF